MSNQETIEKLWDNKDQIDFINDQEAKNSVLDALNLLDKGQLRICEKKDSDCLLYTSPSPRDGLLSRMPSSA